MTQVINVNSANNPKYDIYIGRIPNTTEHFGNPFMIGKHGDRGQVIRMFTEWINGNAYNNVEPIRRQWILDNVHKLRGKILGCHCKPAACHGDVYVEMLEANPIYEFRGKYSCLSNFSNHAVNYNGFKYKTAEHAYQSAKATNKQDHDLVAAATNPAQARQLGRRIRKREDFEEKKIGIMGIIVYSKFSQNEDAKQILVRTGYDRLIEGNWWGDMVWGMVKNKSGEWEGNNLLGEILMLVRDILKKS